MANSLDPHDILEYERILREFDARVGERGFTPGLERIEYLLGLLGDPHLAAPVIHLAGTNGKTSTSRMVESLLSEFGLNTGLTTSPHLHDFRERIRLYGTSIDLRGFIDAYNDIEPYLAMTDEHFSAIDGTRLSYFEVGAALAFAAFAEAPVDVAIIETGLGGRLDATNVVQPQVVVITPIGLDHQDMLGDTIEQIAAEKAQIIKAGSIAVIGKQTPAALEVLLARVADVGAAVFVQDQDFGVVERNIAVGGQVLTLRGLGGDNAHIYTDVVLPLHGQHQADNAALALAAVEAFLGIGAEGRDVDADNVHAGFGCVTSPGRLEVIRRGPTVLVDAAHNPHGVAALARTLVDEFQFDGIVVVLGVFADKDVETSLGILEPVVQHLIATQPIHERALDAEKLAASATAVFGAERVETQARLDDAIARAIEIADLHSQDGETFGVVITGSIATVAQARALLGKRSAS